jgi:uncharacterized protein YjbI with pentapeptide repeats
LLLEPHAEFADLQGADLQGANLERANLRGATLQGAILWGADLEGVKNLTEAQIQSARTDDKTKLPAYLKIKPRHNFRYAGG